MSSQTRLFHYSEDPNIRRFEPRPRPARRIEGRPDEESLVWAIDEWHSPMYFFPRDCPRLLLWPIKGSTDEDIVRWMGGDQAKIVAYIEHNWVDRFNACNLYRYEFDSSRFESLNDAGMHVSTRSAEPMNVQAIGDLGVLMGNNQVELKYVDSLQDVSLALQSTLHFSAIRTRNAREWNPAI